MLDTGEISHDRSHPARAKSVDRHSKVGRDAAIVDVIILDFAGAGGFSPKAFPHSTALTVEDSPSSSCVS